MAGILIDVGPLRRFPQFRRLWTGYAIRQIGSQIAVTTVIYQVFTITRSNLDVGLLSIAQLGPAILAPVVGGAIADAIDRRLLLIGTAILLAFCSVGLALNTAGGHPKLWPIYVLSGATMGLSGVDGPTRQAVLMTVVDRESFVAANVLRQILQQFANIGGPGAAGLLIAVLSHHLAVVYWIDVASTLAALQAVVRLPSLRPTGGGTKFSLGSIAEGFHFLRGRQEIQGCFISDLNATILGVPVALFPYMAIIHFHGGSRAFGLLSAGPSIGAVIGSIFSGWSANVRFQGRAVLYAIGLWGIAIVGFGLAPWLWFGVVCLAVAGWANAVSALFRNTIIQLAVPDRLRGRLSSIQSSVVQAGPRLGNGEAGLVAALSSAPISIVSGGIGCIVGILAVAKFMPAFTNFDLAKMVDPDDSTAGAIT